MDIRSLLQANNDKLLKLYEENLDVTVALQATLIQEVLPHVRDELQLDANAMSWANEWLEDTGEFSHVPGSDWYLNFHLVSIFQFLRVSLTIFAFVVVPLTRA
jgi:hypothetical protein